MSGEWQLIDTAPRNRTDVLVYTEKGQRVVARWNGHFAWQTRPGNYRVTATHWQPLPAAPEVHS